MYDVSCTLYHALEAVSTSAIPKVTSKSVYWVGSLGFLLVLAKVRSEPRAETHRRADFGIERQPIIINKFIYYMSRS